MPALRAIGFDLGETLVYSPGIPLSWRDEYPSALVKAGNACGLVTGPNHIAAAIPILERYNTRLTPRAQEIPAATLFAEVCTAWELRDDEYIERMAEAFFGHFRQELLAYPEARPVLETLRKRGVSVGILTDVPYGMPDSLTREYLTVTGLEELAGPVVTSVSVGVRKPEIAGYLQLASRLGVSVNEMVFVGNESKDIEGANRAGAYSVLIDREGKLSNWGQRERITSLLELLMLPGLEESDTRGGSL